MTSVPSNALPIALTSLLGRDRETLDVRDLLQSPSVRLVTLTGPGGIGKTRLGMHVASGLAEAFPDGVWFVQLEAIRDADLVLPTIAQTLRVPDSGEGDITSQLAGRIGTGRVLLVLDNFEQVVDAAPSVGELLARCPGAKALVTSRAPIEVYGEREYPLEPLPLPATRLTSGYRAMLDYPAVRLFVERAAAARPSFGLTEENAPDVVAICQRLDGLPLAIELAAARIKVLSPAALLARLENRLHLLTSGPRGLPARQQTMRDTIAWSYDLLQPSEQRLFRILSVFSGGFTLDAVEHIIDLLGEADLDALSALDDIERLVDQSLVRQTEDSASADVRFSLFQTISEFAADQLRAHGESPAVQSAHARVMVDLAVRATPELTGPRQVEWFDRLEREHDNIRAALAHAIAGQDAFVAQGIAGRLWRFWRLRGHLTEGRRWLDQALALPGEPLTPERAASLRGAASLADDQGEYDLALPLYEETLVVARSLGDELLEAHVLDSLALIEHDRSGHEEALRLHNLASALYQKAGNRPGLASTLLNQGTVHFFAGDLDASETSIDQAREIFEELGDVRGVGLAFGNLAILEMSRGNIERATQLQEECLRATEAVGDEMGQAIAMTNLADNYRQLGNLSRATELNQRALEIGERTGARKIAALARANLGQIASTEGDSPRAVALLIDAITGAWESEDLPSLNEMFGLLAQEAAALGDPHFGARILGAGQALKAKLGHRMSPDEVLAHEEIVALIRASAGDEAFERSWGEGKSAPLEEIIDQIRGATALADPAIGSREDEELAQQIGLNRRELTALRLFAGGRDTAEIATELGLSLEMATALIGRLYTRVGADSRAGLTAFAFKHGVV